MIGIIVPAHNEEATIGHCIESLLAAAAHPFLQGEDVRIMIVMDACTDATRDVVADYTVQSIEVNYQNVGSSRAAGADLLIQQSARWLAFTDADTVVPVSWLVDQVRFETDAVCGTVKVDDWSLHSDAVRERYDSLYTPIEGHQHIHGANLGVDARAYQSVGGFKPLKAHEDVHLINGLKNAGASITWTTVNCVTTSARLDCRCREGFGDYLRSLALNPILATA
jgi:glycosyltransferase involved in cell wall biosynthesis